MKSLPLALCAAVSWAAAPAALALAPDKGVDRCALERWRVKDGLPSDAVQALAQAADGQLWIATLGGLARYDGVRFQRIYGPRDGRAADSDVRRLLAAHDGSVWAGSPYFEPLRFVDGAAGGERPGWPAGQGTLAWTEDGRGQLWAATPGALLRFVDGRFIPHAVSGLEGRPTALQVDTSGTVWLGTDRGLFSLVGGRLQRHPAVPPAAPVLLLHEDRRRVLWAAAGDRLFAIDGAGATALAVPGGSVAALADDADGNLWVATSVGLGRVRDGRLTTYTVADGLPENDVTAVLVDREGSLWVGTRNAGVAQFSDRTIDTRDGPPSVAEVEVVSLCEDGEGALWFGTQRKGAVRWKDGRETVVNQASGLPSDFVYSFLPGDQGDVWIGTAAGLVRWQGGAIRDRGVWPQPAVALYRDRQGALWIGGNGELGQLADGHLTRFGPGEGIPSKQVRAIGQDGQGTIWVAGVGGPLVRREGTRFVRPVELRGFRTSPVRSMLLDRQGVFWLSADRAGLLRIGPGGVQPFDIHQGLEAEMVYQLLEDDAGELWVGTNKSILRVSRASFDAVTEGRRPALEVVSFETTDRRAGVVAAALRQPSAWKTRNGRLWFATQHGAVSIDPRGVRSNVVPPPVVIEAVLADGRSARDRLPPRPGRVELHYAARTLLEPGKVRYRYRLEGVDAGWVEAGARRVASYLDLPAGTFRFRVQASNNDRIWSEEGASLLFTIASPLYVRPWFFALCALALAPVVLGLHRARLARVHARYAGMFAERNRMARELHDTLLQGMTGIGMQLSAISARLPPGTEEPRRELERLRDTVSRCLEETRRAVWDLRDRRDERGALGPALGRFARRQFRDSDTACEVSVEGTPRPLPHAVEDELFRMAQEALRNAAAHARAARVVVRLRYEPDRVVLTVSDDGRGLGPEAAGAEARGHFGLLSLHERAARIGGTLSVRSEPGRGTTIEVMAPAHA